MLMIFFLFFCRLVFLSAYLFEILSYFLPFFLSLFVNNFAVTDSMSLLIKERPVKLTRQEKTDRKAEQRPSLVKESNNWNIINNTTTLHFKIRT